MPELSEYPSDIQRACGHMLTTYGGRFVETSLCFHLLRLHHFTRKDFFATDHNKLHCENPSQTQFQQISFLPER